MNKPNLDARLLSVARFVREGAYVCDVGTDHAYLPVYLILTGRAAHALASDINKGPVLRAKESVAKYGVTDKIEVILSDGLAGAEAYPVTDIIVAGMGGELIASILEAAEWIKNERYRLILQPMTHSEALREYLSKNCFSVIDEALVKDVSNNKIYQIICAEFSGKEDSYTADELYLGRHNIARGGEVFLELCERLKKINTEIKIAKESAGQETLVEDELISVADKYLR